MHRLRDALRDRYAALLKDKVHSQRELLQQRDETTRRGKSQDETKKVNLNVLLLKKTNRYLGLVHVL